MEKYSKDGQATDDNVIRCIPLAWWLSNATHTHSEYAIFFSISKAAMTKLTRLNIMFLLTLLVLSVRPSVLYAFLKTDSGSNIRPYNSATITVLGNLVTNT